ncbi:MAG TPA: thioester dehydrase [Gammaproteobacteria bacterium]|nr:thioester dehydrase [Gammaproteobacteria bacterium]
MNGLPHILARRETEGRTELDLEVQADNPWFTGHFPETAILPGVVQIGWAVHFGHVSFGLGPGIDLMEQVKFRRPILPGARVTLMLKADVAAGKLRYEYKDAEHVYSSGSLRFGTAP